MTPSPAPKCPPVTETALIVSARNSLARAARSLSFSMRRSAGEAIRSSKGVAVAGFVTNIPERRRPFARRSKGHPYTRTSVGGNRAFIRRKQGDRRPAIGPSRDRRSVSAIFIPASRQHRPDPGGEVLEREGLAQDLHALSKLGIFERFSGVAGDHEDGQPGDRLPGRLGDLPAVHARK